MDIKEFADKKKLSVEERNQLIEELKKDPKGFLEDCFIDELPLSLLKVIENEGLKDADIAYTLYRKWNEDEVNGENEDIDCSEKEDFWFIKACELNSVEVLDDFIYTDNKGEYEFYPFDICRTDPIFKKAVDDCFNSWGCRFALGLDGYEVNYLYACRAYELSDNPNAKISLYNIYAKGLGVKKNLPKAFSYIKDISPKTPFYAFKSNLSEGIKIKRPNKKDRIKYNLISKASSLFYKFIGLVFVAGLIGGFIYGCSKLF